MAGTILYRQTEIWTRPTFSTRFFLGILFSDRCPSFIFLTHLLIPLLLLVFYSGVTVELRVHLEDARRGSLMHFFITAHVQTGAWTQTSPTILFPLLLRSDVYAI